MRDFNYSLNSYGWEWFKLSTPEQKADYMMAYYYSSLPRTLTPTQKAAIMLGLFGVTVDEENGTELHVDHNSLDHFDVMNDALWIACFEHVVNNPAVTIYGGNDNDSTYDIQHEKLDAGGKLVECRFNPETMRYKRDGDTYVLFNRLTGAKTRIYLGLDPNPPAYTKAAVPELVDLKITDHCLTGCSFCYQNSTPEGKHADFSKLKDILYHLERIGVFEVAIGGGDPMSYPYLKDLLSMYRYSRNLNFTVFEPTFVDLPYTYGARFAISNPTPANIRKFMAWSAQFKAGTCNFHIIEGVHSKKFLTQILDTVAVVQKRLWAKRKPTPTCQVLVLGYKATGRGKPRDVSVEGDWLDSYLTAPYAFHPSGRNCSVAVDTALLRNRPWLQNKLNRVLFHTQEGKFSCYIDAVAGVVARSSYEPETSEPYNRDTFEEVWSKW